MSDEILRNLQNQTRLLAEEMSILRAQMDSGGIIQPAEFGRSRPGLWGVLDGELKTGSTADVVLKRRTAAGSWETVGTMESVLASPALSGTLPSGKWVKVEWFPADGQAYASGAKGCSPVEGSGPWGADWTHCCCPDDEDITVSCCSDYGIVQDWSVDLTGCWADMSVMPPPSYCDCGEYCGFMNNEFALTYTESPTVLGSMMGGDGWYAAGDLPGCIGPHGQVQYYILFGVGCTSEVPPKVSIGLQVGVGTSGSLSATWKGWGYAASFNEGDTDPCPTVDNTCLDRLWDPGSGCSKISITGTAGGGGAGACCRAIHGSTAKAIRQDL
ncbi:MAG: hypothetical protein GY835_04075 [bacterium]|nr:hypothetical protein [bacterium]